MKKWHRTEFDQIMTMGVDVHISNNLLCLNGIKQFILLSQMVS